MPRKWVHWSKPVKFRIRWIDPTTKETITRFVECFDDEDMTALEWARDQAYTLADKGGYAINEEKE